MTFSGIVLMLLAKPWSRLCYGCAFSGKEQGQVWSWLEKRPRDTREGSGMGDDEAQHPRLKHYSLILMKIDPSLTAFFTSALFRSNFELYVVGTSLTSSTSYFAATDESLKKYWVW